MKPTLRYVVMVQKRVLSFFDDNFRELHIYGGLLCLATGLSLMVSLGSALVAVGAVAIYLGIWRIE